MQLRILLTFLTFFFFLNLSQSQSNSANTWMMYFGQNRLTEKWSIHSELQYRNLRQEPNNIDQLLTRLGMNYHFNANTMISGGYGFIARYNFDAADEKTESAEHRVWQQLILINKIKRIKLEHRYRIEQRWIDDQYKNRMRYRLMAFIPINKPSMQPGALFVGLYEEVFINPESVVLEVNRLYGALGYQLNKKIGFQIGVLNQYTPEGKGTNHLQLAIVYNPDFRS